MAVITKPGIVPVHRPDNREPQWVGPFTERTCHEVFVDGREHTRQEIIDYLHEIGAPGLLAVKAVAHEIEDYRMSFGTKIRWHIAVSALRVRCEDPAVAVAIKFRFKLLKNTERFRRDRDEVVFRTGGSV